MDLLDLLSDMRKRGEPVALATVVASRRPASARPGDRALVLAGGDLVGWIGGSCARPAVQREGLRALADGHPRLIHLSPEVGTVPPQEGVVEDVMTCHSGGTLEIYVEPFLPAPWLVVTGDSPVADALAKLGALDDFRVLREVPRTHLTPPAPLSGAERGEQATRLPLSAPERGPGGEVAFPGGERYVVVAGMSGDDEHTLERALALDPSYVSFVGSRQRLADVTARLRERGVADDALTRVKGPAGLDIGAVTAVEIAVSIMAEIVQHRRRGALHLTPRTSGAAAAADEQSRSRGHERAVVGEVQSAVPEAVDPVCGMRVAIPGARHVHEYHGQRYYFCCPSCRRLFVENPTRYLDAHQATPDQGVSSDAVSG